MFEKAHLTVFLEITNPSLTGGSESKGTDDLTSIPRAHIKEKEN